ncbi:hypothetical protein FPV67DRAFT_1628753 [Lyophyllum atratum]|nr:hypothetical protein FPV67DRAFT_1628753 [Lyophyllum atratum]
MVTSDSLDISESHPLASELSSLRAAVTRFQDEAYSSSVKLQRHSLDIADAHDRVTHLERENDLLRSELGVLRTHPHPDALPQAQPAALQVQQLTLSLRRLSDKLSLTEEALLEGTTQLAQATGEVTKAKLTTEGAYELAARTRGREEAGKSRELELEWKVRAAEEAMKMSDLVVNEYADLVRSLETKAGTRTSSSSLLVNGQGPAQNGDATLTGSLAEGKLGLQRLLAEFSAETENLQKGLLQAQGELAASEAKRDSEKKYAEQSRVELAHAQYELQQLKIDDNAAAKMVSRYMKFSQKSTDTLQDALTTLKTRHCATVDTLSAQLSHLSSRLHFSESQTEKLRDALDELGGEMVKETYGRRREVALRIRMVNREEKLREELERWVLRAEEALARENADPRAVQDRMVRDARAVLSDTLGGVSGSSDGSLARLITAQNAVEMLRMELELETRRRLELERILAEDGRGEDEDQYTANGIVADHTPPSVLDDPSPDMPVSVTPVLSTTKALPSTPNIIDDLDLGPPTKTFAAPVYLDGSEALPSNRGEAASPHLDRSSTPGDTIVIIPEQVAAAPKGRSTPDIVASTLHGGTADAATDDMPPPTMKGLEVNPTTSVELPHIETIPYEGQPGEKDEVLAESLDDQTQDISDPRMEQQASRTPSPSPSPSLSPMSIRSSSPAPYLPPVAVHLDTPKRLPHPLLAELSKAKHRYDDLQRALRDCHLALETLSSSVSKTLEPRSNSGSVQPDVLRTALQRLNDYTEDARVELEIRMADEALVARGFETLLSIPGALSSTSTLGDDQDAPSRSDVERQIEEFVSGTDVSVEKALRSLSRKLEDIEHDITALKRAIHDDVFTSLPPLTAPATNGGGESSWTSWIRSPPLSPANSLASATSPAPTFGNVMTTPRLRHSPSLNFQGSQGRRVPSDTGKDPLSSLGLRVPMPSYIHHAVQQPQPRSRTLSTMYMLGLGARRPSVPLATSPRPSPRKNGPPPGAGDETEEETDADEEDDDTDVE